VHTANIIGRGAYTSLDSAPWTRNVAQPYTFQANSSEPPLNVRQIRHAPEIYVVCLEFTKCGWDWKRAHCAGVLLLLLISTQQGSR
jgi:hypothetical protein